MEWPKPIVYGTLLARQKRFLANIRLQNGEEIWAHCPNPGSMRGNAEKNSRVWLHDYGMGHKETGRKLRYRWLVVESQKNSVCIDTSLGNKIFVEAIPMIPELKTYKEVVAEVSVGESRLDFLLKAPKKKDCYVEVKSVSMGSKKIAYFPDSVTTRGQKHIKELVTLVKKGHRAVLFFLVMREDSQEMQPASEIDPEYAKLLKWGIGQGVEALAYKVSVTNKKIQVWEKIPLVVE